MCGIVGAVSERNIEKILITVCRSQQRNFANWQHPTKKEKEA